MTTQFKIGDKVNVASTYAFAAEWNGTYYVAALRAKEETGEIDLAISDHWPPRHRGDYTDGWKEADLTPAPDQQAAAA